LGGCDRKWNRDNVVELSRLAASRAGLCRVVLRAWREFALPEIASANGFIAAASYQDVALHSGNTYRFDGWRKIGDSHSGTDTRTGRPGRRKSIWLWEIPRDN
jgi:antitoxin VapB